ncbi:hypothetical protein GZ78_12230 [Endozoicomonas numazuensis]|uniref:Uncharacterized protein n=1 Tax=Endozoicomonas numazuensis TaxID=1137799 RepID=A0A081NIL0_9GAMM|nr:hypothetical protein GZ78_12230 [Endozoicomonas numazuensis]
MRKLPVQSSYFNHKNAAIFIIKWAALFSHGGIVILLKTLFSMKIQLSQTLQPFSCFGVSCISRSWLFIVKMSFIPLGDEMIFFAHGCFGHQFK